MEEESMARLRTTRLARMLNERRPVGRGGQGKKRIIEFRLNFTLKFLVLNSQQSALTIHVHSLYYGGLTLILRLHKYV